MKIQKTLIFFFGLLLAVSQPALAKKSAAACESLFDFKVSTSRGAEKSDTTVKEGRKKGKSTTTETSSKAASETRQVLALEDQFILQGLGDIGFSYRFFGQTLPSASLYTKAVETLVDSGLTIEGIQKAHRTLTNEKATLKFRDTNEAKFVGAYSFKGFSDLRAPEIRAVESNPFLTFVRAKEVTNIGVIDKENLIIGDIMFPNHTNTKKFAELLSKETLDLVKELKDSKNPEPKDSAIANEAILNDLLTWTLKDAQTQLKKDSEAIPQVLALLEWRVKSLGLYYESTAVTKGSYMESKLDRVDLNRSNELAEAVVDAFVVKHNLSKKSLDRGFRPKLSDNFSEWSIYMKSAFENASSANTKKLVQDLQDIAKDLKESDREVFETYYQSLLMTGELKSKDTAESLFKGFKSYKETHYRSDIPDQARALLIPIEFIKNFSELPGSFKEYLDKYYFQDATLFRGVSNPNVLSESNLLGYFKNYKGRFASEVGRSIFAKRTELTKLAMLQYNADLIAGKVVETAAQHAAKHMGYASPNSAKTYFVSAADLSTIAFRFAMDKGYIDRSSSNAGGTTHIVLEFKLPKYGVVDFSAFKLTDPTWKNYFPRQHETSIAGGMDPNSLQRIYILEAYSPKDKIPHNGPEKHGRIIKILERDENAPLRIDIKLKNEKTGEWVVRDSVDLKAVKED